MGWTPKLEPGSEPVYMRLATAIEQDVGAGALGAGARLPPQRELAFALGVSVGAVTRAYSEAERRGLVRAHVGRGTFVTGPGRASGPFSLDIAPEPGVIDLARNRPPPRPAASRFRSTLLHIERRGIPGEMLDYPPPAGLERHRRILAAWMVRGRDMAAYDHRRLVVTNGAQQAMGLAFGAVCRPGETILCEAATFQGMKALAEHVGYKLAGVPMDQEGLAPDALDRALGATRAKALYVLPTLQNPTARTMSAERRAAIAAVCSRHGAWIVEDDLYEAYTERVVQPIAAIAPERTFYISGASKILAPGLRVGLLQVPNDEILDRILRAIRAANYAPPAFGAAIMVQWIEDGAASDIESDLREELKLRNALVREILKDTIDAPSSDLSLHLWLPMSELDAERVAGRALRAGVEVTPPDATAAPGCPVEGIRLCLGAPASRDLLETALRTVSAALRSEVGGRSRAVV